MTPMDLAEKIVNAAEQGITTFDEFHRYDFIEGFRLEDIHPRPHHLLIRWPGRNETKGGIIIQQDRERMGRMNGILLALGPNCDNRLHVGQTVQFAFNTQKEWLGVQSPGDRDPVFFMREEDLIGITMKTGFDVEIQLLNGCVMAKPILKPSEACGLIVPNPEAKDTFSTWGKVVQTDSQWNDDEFMAGDDVLYDRNQAEELRLGDFSEDVMHIIRQRQGAKVHAQSSSSVMTAGEIAMWEASGKPKYESQPDGSVIFYVLK